MTHTHCTPLSRMLAAIAAPAPATSTDDGPYTIRDCHGRPVATIMVPAELPVVWATDDTTDDGWPTEYDHQSFLYAGADPYAATVVAYSEAR